MILLIRHAEKSLTGNQDLTMTGLTDAYLYGQKLKNQGVHFDEIISSPIKRCLQTAEEIIKGLDVNLSIEQSQLLGDPGIFVIDDKKAITVFNELTVQEVINHQLQKKSLSGFLPIDKACQPLIKEIKKKINTNKSILYISHDAIIDPFVAYLNKTKFINESEMVQYLMGYLIVQLPDNSLQANAYSNLSQL